MLSATVREHMTAWEPSTYLPGRGVGWAGMVLSKVDAAFTAHTLGDNRQLIEHLGTCLLLLFFKK